MILALNRRVGLLVPALFIVAELVHNPGVAAQDRLSLSLHAPSGCPSRAVVESQIRELVGDLGEGPPVAATFEITHDETGYHLVLETRSGETVGHRNLDGDACDQVANAGAMIVAWMIDPEAMETADDAIEVDRAEPEHTTPAAALTDPAPPPEDVIPRRARSTRERSASVDPPRIPSEEGIVARAGLRGGLDVGSLPNPMGVLTATGAVGIPLLEGRLRATALFPSESEIPAISGATSSTYAFSFEGLACVRPFDEARFLGACGGLVLGVLVAEGHGVATPATGVGTNLGATVEITFAWPVIAELELELGAGLLVPFSPFELEVGAGGSEVVFYTQEPVAGRFAAGANVVF